MTIILSLGLRAGKGSGPGFQLSMSFQPTLLIKLGFHLPPPTFGSWKGIKLCHTV